MGGTAGLTQSDAPSILNGTRIDGSPFGSVTGVTVAKDGTVTAQFSNGLSQDVYKIPIATFTNPDGLGQVNGNAYVVTKAIGRRQHQSGQYRQRGQHPVQIAGSFDGRSGDRVHQSDHDATRLFGIGAHHHHRGSDAAAAGTVADQLMNEGKRREKPAFHKAFRGQLSEAFIGSFTTSLGLFLKAAALICAAGRGLGVA